MSKRIAILGCGPAGLLAAHAGKLMGHNVVVYSHYKRSPMLGAQYMHRPIPELKLESTQTKLAYMLHGPLDGYREKVYGENIEEDIQVSPQTFVGYHESWSIRKAYNILWQRYNKIVVDRDITHDLLSELVGNFDHVLSTVPAPLLCYQEQYHHFGKVKVWVDSLWHGENAPYRNSSLYGAENVVICNGFPVDHDRLRYTGWYRTSLIYGHANTEWPVSMGVKPAGASVVYKPISTNCNCWPTIVRAGRYGAWHKGILSHEAFEMALEAFA